jgi:gliding motility-associatede transport system auxiliary component
MNKREKNPAARYAFIGLIIALLACISTGLLGILQGAVALQMFKPAKPETITLALQISAALIIAGLATYALMAPDTIRRFISGRQARYGSNALIMTLAFIGVIVVVNYIVYQNPKSWDLTEDKSHTLAPETLQALATLPDKVSAVAFYSTSLPRDSAQKLLTDFKNNSKGKFDFRFVDPDADPLAAREAGITGDGKIMLVMGERKEIASSANENELTRTLIRLISPEARVIYFLTGHGERGLEGGGGNDQVSYSVAKTTLESKNYIVNPLNLLADKKIPEDASVIVIAGPQKPLSDEEVTTLKEYVDKGGSLIVMEDPTVVTDFGDSPDPLAAYLASDWGITLDSDIIIDLSTQQGLNAISAAYNQHAITQNLSANYVVIMPQARSVSVSGQLEGINATPLISTSANSWGETNFTSAEGDQIKFDEGSDLPGPLSMAVAADNATTKGRVVVFGNSLFAGDQLFDAYGNGNIFVNSVDWSAEQENLINITPRTPVQRTLHCQMHNWL